MGLNWIPLALGAVAVVFGVFMLVNRDRASKSITNAQRAVFPFLARTLSKKTDSNGVAAASVAAMVIGALLIVLSVVSVFHQG